MQAQGGRRLRYFYFWLAAVLGVASDLLSKHYTFKFLDNCESQRATIIDGFLYFTKSVNPGAVWGLGAGRSIILMSATALIVPLVVWMAYSCKEKTAPLWSLGLILAGAAGNLYDRVCVAEEVFRQGGIINGVRDFIDVGWWPVFNIADVAIVVGVGCYLVWNIRLPDPEKQKTEENSSE